MKKTIVFTVSLLFLCVNGFSQGIKEYEFSGSFYPAEARDLENAVESFIARAVSLPIRGKILGIISPHAGYRYCGAVAGHGYKACSNMTVDVVVILAPHHRRSFEGVVIYGEGFFSTPLGKVAIDQKSASCLGEAPYIRFDPALFYREHSLEVQLPFIQQVFPTARIVPLLFGRVGRREMEDLADALYGLSQKKNIIVIVSTDLSHYHPYQEAKAIDNETIEAIEKMDIDWLIKSFVQGRGRACGMLPLVTFLFYVQRQGGHIQTLAYANSGDVTGDVSAVVGYVSMLGYITENEINEEETMELTKQDKKVLLRIARMTLESYLGNRGIPEFTVDSEILKEKRAVFVTLKKDNDLRGCIGRIVADLPLYTVVSRQILEAALHDPRFPPVSSSELKDIEIEISVMTPFEKVESLSEIQVGKHGLMIKKGFRSGLLLPQVPGEYGWDKQTFLEHLCRKAGLPADAYKDRDSVIYKFSAEVFSEKELAE